MIPLLLCVIAGLVAIIFLQAKKIHLRRFQLVMALQLSATQPVAIAAHVQQFDSEENPVGASTPVENFTVTLENVVGDFGSMTDENSFNPGTAGATGTIKVTATIDDVDVSGAVDIELVAGAATHTSLAIDLTPEDE